MRYLVGFFGGNWSTAAVEDLRKHSPNAILPDLWASDLSSPGRGAPLAMVGASTWHAEVLDDYFGGRI